MSRILITGGTGTFGHAATARFLAEGYTVTIFSRDEQKQELMEKQFPSARYFLGDVRDKERLVLAMQGQDIVIHAAALKIVAKCEFDPLEAIETNIAGTANVIKSAIGCRGLKKVVFISTDKAVHPVNLYGATKKTAEHAVLSANNLRALGGPLFSVVRYGNVWRSRGSVLEHWENAAAENRKAIVTSPHMTRFLLTAGEAVDLVAFALNEMQGGEIFVPKMRAYTIAGLRAAFKTIYPCVQFVEVGARPGEKIHEKILSSQEASLAHFHPQGVFIVKQAPPEKPSAAAFANSCGVARVYPHELALLIKETANG